MRAIVTEDKNGKIELHIDPPGELRDKLVRFKHWKLNSLNTTNGNTGRPILQKEPFVPRTEYKTIRVPIQIEKKQNHTVKYVPTISKVYVMNHAASIAYGILGFITGFYFLEIQSKVMQWVHSLI